MSSQADLSRASIVVTGGSGFIGTNLVGALSSRDVVVTNLDLRPPLDRNQHKHWQQTDILDRRALATSLRSLKPSAVIHLAARTDLDGKNLEDYAANIEGTSNLMQALDDLATPPRLIVASTRMVCKIGYQPRYDSDYCPPNAYGASKVATERLLHDSDYAGTWALVRPTSIWGPWFGVPYRDFFLAVAKGHYRHPGHRSVRKSFGYIENTVHQLLSLVDAGAEAVDGRTFYLADYEPIELESWADQIQVATGGPVLRSVPLPVLRVAARVGDLLKRAGIKEPPLTTFRLRNLLTDMVHDLEPIRSIAPELPVGGEEAVVRTAEWMRGVGDIGLQRPKR